MAPAVGPFPRPSNVAQEACNEPHNQSSSPPGFASQAGCAPGASQQARSHRHTAGLPSAGCPQSIGSVSPEAKDHQAALCPGLHIQTVPHLLQHRQHQVSTVDVMHLQCVFASLCMQQDHIEIYKHLDKSIIAERIVQSL